MKDRHEEDHLARLRSVAEREADALLKALPAEVRECLAGVTFAFEGRPVEDADQRNVATPDVFSATRRQRNEIAVYLMSLDDRYGKFPGDFRRELRRALLKEIGDWTGADLVGEG